MGNRKGKDKMKKIGYIENSEFLRIYAFKSYMDDLAIDIEKKFDICAVKHYNFIEISKTPLVEDSDIKEIKNYVDQWVENKIL